MMNRYILQTSLQNTCKSDYNHSTSTNTVSLKIHISGPIIKSVAVTNLKLRLIL